jgi:hypothetical protein
MMTLFHCIKNLRHIIVPKEKWDEYKHYYTPTPLTDDTLQHLQQQNPPLPKRFIPNKHSIITSGGIERIREPTIIYFS